MLPLLEVKARQRADFSGIWILNEDESSFDNSGAADVPSKISVIQHKNELEINKTFIVEYDDDRMVTQKLNINGPDFITKSENSTIKTTSKYLTGTDAVEIETKTKTDFVMNAKPLELVTTEKWNLTGRGKKLVIEQYSDSFGAKKNIKMVYDKAIN